MDTEVRILNDISTGKREHCHEDVVVFEDDTQEADLVADTMVGVNVVFHEAAIVGVVRSIETPAEPHSVNVDATLALLEVAREADARVVYTSSAAVYGQPEAVAISDDDRRLVSMTDEVVVGAGG